MRPEPAPSALELMAIQVETLFRHDAEGRLTTVNEAGGGPAPRVFLGRTAEGTVWRLRDDLPDALAARLAGILAKEPPLGDPAAPAAGYARLIASLEAAAPVERVWSGPAWWIPDDVPLRNDIIPMRVTDPACMHPGFPGWASSLALVEPCVAVFDHAEAVAVCCAVRSSPRASEAGVETLEGYRGRGYASAAVAAWAAEVRRAGRLPLYSTSWDNHASRAVARRLGLRLYGVDPHVT